MLEMTMVLGENQLHDSLVAFIYSLLISIDLCFEWWSKIIPVQSSRNP